MLHYTRVVVLALAGLIAGSFTAAGAAEFKPSTVSVFIASGTGGGYDAYGRLTARHLGKFLPGNPAMVPKNQPGAGGIVLANTMYNVAPKDGSAIAILQAGTPFEPLFGNTQAKFDPLKFNWLISLNKLTNIGIFWHTTPIKTVNDLFKGDVLVGSSGGGGASTEVYPKLLNNLAHTHFKVVTGYKGTGETGLAMERGEVEGMVGTELSSLRANRPDWIRDKKIRIVIQVGITKSPELPGVASALDLVKDEDGKKVFELLLARQEHGRVFLAPPGVPAATVATLRTGFEKMAKDLAFLKDAEKLHAEIVVNSHEDVEALLKKTYASPKPLVERAIAEFRKAGGIN